MGVDAIVPPDTPPTAGTVGGVGDTEVTSCYRHPDRHSGVICQRCDRPICAECRTQASVGFHCPECLRGGRQQVYRGPVTFDPIVTKVLIGINVVASLLALGASGGLGGLSLAVLTDWSLFAPPVDLDGETYRLATSAFLHNGLIHLGFNMAALWVLGSSIERAFGRVRFVSIYVVSLLGGGFGVLLLDPNAGTVGASGAVFGLFGAAVVTQRDQGIDIWESGLGAVLGLNLLITFVVPQISIGGHLGGLAAGTVLTLMLLPLVRVRRDVAPAVAIASLMAIALYAGSVWAAAQWADPLF